ncbi:MAG: hypothetical protein WCI73_10010, partial [Phycisphaerae bacterium]
MQQAQPTRYHEHWHPEPGLFEGSQHMAAKNSPKDNSSNSDDALAALHNLLGHDTPPGTPSGPETPGPQHHDEDHAAANDPLAALMNVGRQPAPAAPTQPEPTFPLSSPPAAGMPLPQVKPTPVAEPVGFAGVNNLGKSPMKASAEPSADTLSASGFVSMLAKSQFGG